MTPLSILTAHRQLDDFVDYVDSFYGQNDPLYPLYYEGQPLTKEDIRHASIVYLDRCQSEDFENCTWGDGDSLDRERVRDILTDKFNYSYSVLTSFNKGNWAWKLSKNSQEKSINSYMTHLKIIEFTWVLTKKS